MTCFGELPELVVANIFKYISYCRFDSISDLKLLLPLLAFNSNWWGCGVSLAYKTLVIDYHITKDDPTLIYQPLVRSVSNVKITTKQVSNIELFGIPQYRKLTMSLVMSGKIRADTTVRTVDALQLLIVSLVHLLFPSQNDISLGYTNGSTFDIVFNSWQTQGSI